MKKNTKVNICKVNSQIFLFQDKQSAPMGIGKSSCCTESKSLGWTENYFNEVYQSKNPIILKSLTATA